MANGTSNGAPGETRRPWTTVVVILLVIFLAAGAYFELRPRRIRISVVKPVRQTISNSITTNGKVEPIRGFEAHAPLAVTVQKVLVSEGAHVKAGQLLLVLDDSRARGDLATAETRLKAAQAAYSNLLAGGTPAAVALAPGRVAESHHRREMRPSASLPRWNACSSAEQPAPTKSPPPAIVWPAPRPTSPRLSRRSATRLPS